MPDRLIEHVLKKRALNRDLRLGAA